MANTKEVSETYHLEFSSFVGTQNRTVIIPYVVEVAELKPGDKVFLTLTKVVRG